MDLNWEHDMQRILHADIARYLNNPYAIEILKKQYCPNIIIKSKSPVVTCAYINTLVCCMANLKVSNLYDTLTHNIEGDYFHNNYFFVFNVNYNTINIIKNIVNQKCITMSRHIIVLNIVEKVSRYALSIRSIINRYLSTTTFIIVNNFDHFVSNSICELMLPINLSFNMELFCNDANVPPEIQNTSLYDPMDICIKMSHLDMSFTDTSNSLENYIFKQLDALNLCKTNQGVRNIAIKLGAACVPISTLSRIILKWRGDPYVVTLLCEMDHIIKQNSKELFAMENFFHQLIKKTDL